MMLDRRAFLAGIGATVAGAAVSERRAETTGDRTDGPRLESWSVTKGVVRLHVVGVHEDESVRVHWRSDGTTWCTEHSVTEARSDGWHAVTDVEKSGPTADEWDRAEPVRVEVTDR